MTILRSGTVLIADDHSLYRAGLSLLLKDRLGFHAVIEAATFDCALDRLAETPNVALALFDLAMPGIAGPESLNVVKETYPDLRVAIVSGSEEREYVLKAVATGLNGYVPKSLTDDEILGAIKDILDGRIYVPRFMTAPYPACRRSRRTLLPRATELVGIRPNQFRQDNATFWAVSAEDYRTKKSPASSASPRER